MTSQKTTTPGQAGRTGLWLVGARGSIACTLIVGLEGLVRGKLDPVGLVTELSPFRELGFCDFNEFVIGGCDVRRTPLAQGVAELVAQNVVPLPLAQELEQHLGRIDERIVAGVLDGHDLARPLPTDQAADEAVLERSKVSSRKRIDALRLDIDAFRSTHQLARVIVVHLASTESLRNDLDAWSAPEAFEAALEGGVDLPASCLYARAAFEAGAAFLNFTPSPGAALKALDALARERNLPHCGNDGKTGETLVKTTLAPMFAHRALRVLSWQGYNMLGNRDGAVLEDPAHKRSKVVGKDQALRSLLPDSNLHSHVGIDFVPSLGDWKTAWDFVHFEGFLGARMSLQFTWTGSDSALAAPLVLDLVRFLERALRLGRGGQQSHLACFFKSPLGGGTHDFHRQFQTLLDWVAAEREQTQN